MLDVREIEWGFDIFRQLLLRKRPAFELRGWDAKGWIVVGYSIPDEFIKLSKNEASLSISSSATQSSQTLSLPFPTYTTGWFGYLPYGAVGEDDYPAQGREGSMRSAYDLNFSYYPANLSHHTPSGKTYIFGVNQAAIDQLYQFLHHLLQTESASLLSGTSPQAPVSNRSPQAYAQEVESIRQSILRGDIFQANLTREISVNWPEANRADIDGFAERLLAGSHAPFGAIIRDGNTTIISASPERFFRIEPSDEGLKVIAEPIKGTRPRHPDPIIDQQISQELLHSEKDRAENIMIADLVRNDLSRLCLDDSIRVERLCELRSFASVHHLVTTVSGILKPGLGAIDALLAQFPCGSITGAPKWAAMDIIAQLEQRPRGIYCGAIGFIDDRGHADFSVAIRTAEVTHSPDGATIRFGVGGGITMLSDPEAEFQETEDKAADFLAALQP